jgi:hypothetical protein
VKVGGRFLLGRLRRSFALEPEPLLEPFERASIGSPFPECRASVANRALRPFDLTRRAAFLGFELEQAKALPNPMKLRSREILSPLEPCFEASPLELVFELGPTKRSRPSLASVVERRCFSLRLPFGLGQCSRARVDLLPPERHERLEGGALLQRSFLSAVTRG